MSLMDRDWYREAYNEKAKKYNNDFSLGSKPNSNIKFGDIYRNGYRVKYSKCGVCKNKVSLHVPHVFAIYKDFHCPKCNNKIRYYYMWYKLILLLICLFSIYSIYIK